MIVKIISAKNRLSWYSNHLNEYFNVEPYNINEKIDYYVITDGTYKNQYIKISDTINLTELRNIKINSL